MKLLAAFLLVLLLLGGAMKLAGMSLPIFDYPLGGPFQQPIIEINEQPDISRERARCLAERDRRDHLFVEDLEAARHFYGEVFGLPVMFEDADSAVFNFGNTIINLLKVSAADSLIEPANVAPPEAGARMQFTIEVDDVDAMSAKLASRGVELLNGPMDRPWGVRTASFRDPAAASGRLPRTAGSGWLP